LQPLFTTNTAQKVSTRRQLTNENDENAASTRVTRAKASANDEGLKRTKSTTSTLAQPRKRAALGDVSNTAKSNIAQAKATTGKQALTKSTAQASKPAKRSVLTSKAKAPTDLKRSHADIDEGSRKRHRSSDAADTENVEPSVDSLPSIKEAKIEKTVVPKEPEVEEPAAPLYPPGVENLDAEDIDDPLMTAEYVHEIFDYLRQLEVQAMPNPKYMVDQPDLEWQMRGILVDWLLEVHQKFRLLPETLFLAVNIIDRFLTSKVVQLDRLQLVGVTALFLASKYEEVLSPHVTNFRHVADDAFNEEEILSAERFILRSLEWNISQYANPMNFLRRISKADDYDVHTRTIGKYLLEISCLDHKFLPHPPSQIAAAAMYLARLIRGAGEWVSSIFNHV
jgi:hypothetical protein